MFERYTEKARRVIFFGRYEASQFGSPYIESEHLLLGLLREDKALTARFLRSGGLDSIREEIERNTTVRQPTSTSVDLPLSNECRRALQFASEEAEALSHKHIGTEHLLMGLLREEKCFAAQLLVERGVDLEQLRKELTRVPHLSERAVEVSRSPWGAIGSAWYLRFHDALPKAAEEGAVIFVDDLHTPVHGNFGSSSVHLQEILKRAVVNGQIQCISVSTPMAYAKSIADHGWLEACFQPIKVSAANEADSILVLQGIKKVYEEFHHVTYTDDALASAVAYAITFIPDRYLPGKAVDLIDEAGSCAKLRHATLPEDVLELQKKIHSIKQRVDSRVDNHEFEKARFYSEEERKERENLRVLREKYKTSETETVVEVTREHIEGVVSRWTGATIEAIRTFRPPEGDGSEKKPA